LNEDACIFVSYTMWLEDRKLWRISESKLVTRKWLLGGCEFNFMEWFIEKKDCPSKEKKWYKMWTPAAWCNSSLHFHLSPVLSGVNPLIPKSYWIGKVAIFSICIWLPLCILITGFWFIQPDQFCNSNLLRNTDSFHHELLMQMKSKDLRREKEEKKH
jgi:hypothetical protein